MPAGEPRPYCERPGCTNRLRGKQTRFCSNSCRATFANQQRTAEARALAESLALEEIRGKVAPVVRDLLTDKVLNELKALTELLPAAVQTLVHLMDSEDEEMRLKAATLLMRYTMGNSSIAPPPLDEKGATPVQIMFGLPQQQSRAELATDAPAEVVDGEVVEAPADRECMECHEFKPPSKFVGESARCQDCHDAMMADVEARFGRLPVLPSKR